VSVATEPSQQAAAERGIEAVYFVVAPSREQLVEIARLVDGGQLRVTVAEVFALSDARAAFERAQQHHGAGKIVLQVAADQ
jgi:NADPH:quinone reductase-like Zn-dependent oxidoreductase